MKTGKILRLRRDKGFGFLQCDEGGPDIFFHTSGVTPKPDGFDALTEGDRVNYDEDFGNRKGPRAENVTLIGRPRDPHF